MVGKIKTQNRTFKRIKCFLALFHAILFEQNDQYLFQILFKPETKLFVPFRF